MNMVKKSFPQTPVDNYILTRLLRELSPSEFVLYLALYELTEGSGLRVIALGIQGLSELTGLSKSSIQRVVKGLKKRRLISVSLLKATSTPEYEVLFPWRKTKAVTEKTAIVKKNIGQNLRPKKETPPLEPSISKLNIDNKVLLEPKSPLKPMSLSEAASKWGKRNPFYRALKHFKEQERHFKKALSAEEQEASVLVQRKRMGPGAYDERDMFGVEVSYSRAIEEWWRVEAPKRGLTLKTKLSSALDTPKRKRCTPLKAAREAEDVARALAVFQEKEKGFKASLTEEEQVRWVEEHLKKLGTEVKTQGKNVLGLDTGYQLAVEVWWKGRSLE